MEQKCQYWHSLSKNRIHQEKKLRIKYPKLECDQGAGKEKAPAALH
jgi:hypothetical protein